MLKVLFVTPSEVSSGEAITTLHVARAVQRSGGRVHLLASTFTARFLRADFGADLTELVSDCAVNERAWYAALRQFRPNIIVFADYPLLFFPNGSVPLADDDWVVRLNHVDAALVTFDHLGYAQRPMTVFFGPAHLSFSSVTTPPLPERMQVLLPCPSNEPGQLSGRRGVPFRYWHAAQRRESGARNVTREAYLRNDPGLLIFHSSSNWAWRLARRFGLPHYDFLPKLMEYYLADLPRSVTIVSVNTGDLLPPTTTSGLRIVNVPSLPSREYEDLFLSSDLLLSDNSVSVSLAKAVCSFVPCAHLHNSFGLLELLDQTDEELANLIQKMEQARLGAIFPYEVFPIWGKEELEKLRLLEGNSITEGFAQLELFGGAVTRQRLHELLLDDVARGRQRERQCEYVRRLASLPEANCVLGCIAYG